MTVVVTGAAGMVGANLLRGLNAIGIDQIIAVDDLTHGAKYRNLRDARIADYLDRSEFYARFARGDFGSIAYGNQVTYLHRNLWSGLGSTPVGRNVVVYSTLRFHLP